MRRILSRKQKIRSICCHWAPCRLKLAAQYVSDTLRDRSRSPSAQRALNTMDLRMQHRIRYCVSTRSFDHGERRVKKNCDGRYATAHRKQRELGPTPNIPDHADVNAGSARAKLKRTSKRNVSCYAERTQTQRRTIIKDGYEGVWTGLTA